MSKILDFNGLRRYDEQIKNWVESGLPIKNADLGSQEFNPKAGVYYHGIGPTINNVDRFEDGDRNIINVFLNPYLSFEEVKAKLEAIVENVEPDTEDANAKGWILFGDKEAALSSVSLMQTKQDDNLIPAGTLILQIFLLPMWVSKDCRWGESVAKSIKLTAGVWYTIHRDHVGEPWSMDPNEAYLPLEQERAYEFAYTSYYNDLFLPKPAVFDNDIYKCIQEESGDWNAFSEGQVMHDGDLIHFTTDMDAWDNFFKDGFSFSEGMCPLMNFSDGGFIAVLDLSNFNPAVQNNYGILVGETIVYAQKEVDLTESLGVKVSAGFQNLIKGNNFIFSTESYGPSEDFVIQIPGGPAEEDWNGVIVFTGELIPPVMEKVILDEDLDAKADLVNGKVPVDEIPDLPVYRNFPASWPTNGTTAAFADAVNADPDAVVGTSYLGDVRFSDLPFGSGGANGELIVDVIGGSVSAKVIHLTLTSGNQVPYRWEYTYWVQAGTAYNSGWVDFQDVYSVSAVSDLNDLPLRKRKPNAIYVVTGTNELYRWNTVSSQFDKVGGEELTFATDEEIDEIFDEEENGEV